MQGNFRNAHALPGAGAHQTAAPQAAAPGARLPDLLEYVRQEFDGMINESHVLKAQLTDFDTHANSHVSEMHALRMQMGELERQHQKVKERYEEEISALRRELDARQVPSLRPADSRSRSGAAGPPTTSAPLAPQVGHGATSLFGGIVGGQPGPSAAPQQADGQNGWAQRDDQHPQKRLRTEGPSDSFPPQVQAPLRPPGSNARTPQVSPGAPGEIDFDAVPRDQKKEGSDWVTIFNPKLPRALDVELVHTLQHDSVVCCVKFSPDGKTLATGCNKSTTLYDTKTGAKQCVLADESPSNKGDNYIRSAAFSPDGKQIATGSEDRIIRIWDIAKRRVRLSFAGHKSEIYSLAFSPDGRQLVSGSGDCTAMVWDAENGQLVRTLTIEEPAPTEGGQQDAGVTSVAFSPDGLILAAGSLDTFVRFWDARTGVLLDKLTGHKDSVYSVAFAPHGDWLVSGSLDKTLKIWDLKGVRTLLATPTIKTEPGADADGPVAKDPSHRASCIHTLSGHKDYVLSVGVSADAQWIVSGSKDRGVSFWAAGQSAAGVVLQGHKNSVISIAVADVGNLLATGSGDWSCRVWRMDRIGAIEAK